MRKTLEKIFTPYTLLVINLAIVFASETIGHGKTFHDTGIIHGIAVLFIILASTRIFQKYYLFDPEIRNMLRYSLWAMAFFAVSHFVEFASFVLFRTYTDAAFANVINFYVASLLFMAMGSEQVFVAYEKRSKVRMKAYAVAIAFFIGLTFLFIWKNALISLEPDEIAPYAYAAVVLGVGIYGFRQWRRVGKLYPWFGGFVKLMTQATTLIMLATFPNIFYELLEHVGVEEVQSIYLSHFTFYAALSVMYLAYGDSLKIGGIHKDIREMMESGEMEA